MDFLPSQHVCIFGEIVSKKQLALDFMLTTSKKKHTLKSNLKSNWPYVSVKFERF